MVKEVLFLLNVMGIFLCSISQGGFGRMGLYPLAWQPLSAPHFRVGPQDSQAGLASQWLHQNQRPGCTCPHGHLLIQTMENWRFFHNWRRLCLGQEPSINYKDWPQPGTWEEAKITVLGNCFLLRIGIWNMYKYHVRWWCHWTKCNGK